MALIKTIQGKTPRFGKNCYLSENATVVGEVEMGDDCSIWFNAVVRGDVNRQPCQCAGWLMSAYALQEGGNRNW